MTETKRLIADRFRRIWHITEEIAANPGHSRLELANLFNMSERQIQADLNIIRCDMHLPLVRRQGYRFTGEGPTTGAGCPDLRDALLLALALRETRAGSEGHRHALLAKLPAMFPPHLTPLVERILEAVTAPRTAAQGHIFTALAEAVLTDSWVRLHYPPHHPSAPFRKAEAIVKPEALLPHLGQWYVLGDVQYGHWVQRTASRMVLLDPVTAVTPIKLPQLVVAGGGR